MHTRACSGRHPESSTYNGSYRTAKASASFSASVLPSTTNSSGDVIGRVSVGLRFFGEHTLPYISSSHSGTVAFEIVSGTTDTILKNKATSKISL